MPAVDGKVDKLEKVIADFVTSVGIEFNKALNLRMRAEAEFVEFKDEMRTFREETLADTKVFKEEMRQNVRDMNKKWGELANKLGTIAEDLVAPSIPRIVREVFDLEVIELTV